MSQTETEGYLSSEKLFNRILFILREPNSDGRPADTFWMRDVVDGIAVGRAATLYKNRLTELVEALGFPGDELKNAAYTNVNPHFGLSQQSEVYKSLPKGKCAREKCEKYSPSIVFTCEDIFDDLWKECGMPERKQGLSYLIGKKTFTLDRFQTGDMTVFAIKHPSRSPKLPSQDLSEVLEH